MSAITPIVLAGGSGSRLWPLSRKSLPKQFSILFGDHSPFQKCVLRFRGSKRVDFRDPIIVTASEYRFIVKQQLNNLGIKDAKIILEPQPKNTGPAILAACFTILRDQAPTKVVVAPSDHEIDDVSSFHKAIGLAIPLTDNNKIVSIVIPPKSVETGYGYVEIDKLKFYTPSNVLSFTEKPIRKRAKSFIKNGSFLWNTGIFVSQIQDLIQAFQTFSTNLTEPVSCSVERSEYDMGFLRLDESSWAVCKSISVDYAIMEHTKNLVALPVSFDWSDLGDWNTLWEKDSPNEKGVVARSNSTAIDCQNTYLRSETSGLHLVGLGLKNIVAVATKDAVLVANKKESQAVREIVPYLKKNRVDQAEASSRDNRPWGWFENISNEKDFKVKVLHINPKASLSLQSHKFRSEHWVVVLGTIKATIDGVIKILARGQSIFVPQGALHRLENPSDMPSKLVEVQTGSLLSEDDIMRYEDVYNRT